MHARLLSHVELFATPQTSLLGCSVHGIFQARILEQVAISFSRGSSWPRDWTCISFISCIGWRILYHWASWEAPTHKYVSNHKGYCSQSLLLLTTVQEQCPSLPLPLNQKGFPGGSDGKESACNAVDPGLKPGQANNACLFYILFTVSYFAIVPDSSVRWLKGFFFWLIGFFCSFVWGVIFLFVLGFVLFCFVFTY